MNSIRQFQSIWIPSGATTFTLPFCTACVAAPECSRSCGLISNGRFPDGKPSSGACADWWALRHWQTGWCAIS